MDNYIYKFYVSYMKFLAIEAKSSSEDCIHNMGSKNVFYVTYM